MSDIQHNVEGSDLVYTLLAAKKTDAAVLAELRVRAMQPSLEAIGRFDPDRPRNRFLDKFDATATQKIMLNDTLAGFFVVYDRADHLWLDHLYIDPAMQGSGLGKQIIAELQAQARRLKKPIRLCALRDSPANKFYQYFGFEFQYEEEWDIYYRWG